MITNVIFIYPLKHDNIHGTFQECFAVHPLKVQNDNCMNAQVRMFIQYSELNAKWIIWILNVVWAFDVVCLVEALGNSFYIML